MATLTIVTRKDGVSYVRGAATRHSRTAGPKPRAPRADKHHGAWRTRPCRGGTEFFWLRQPVRHQHQGKELSYVNATGSEETVPDNDSTLRPKGQGTQAPGSHRSYVHQLLGLPVSTGPL